MSKKLVFLFLTIEKDLLGKDVFLVPYYLGQVLNMGVKIIYLETDTNKDIPHNYRGVELERIRPGKIHREAAFVKYLIRNAKEIDFLMLFHLRYFTAILGILYKILNPKGYTYIKSDGQGFMRKETRNSKSLLHKIVIPLYNIFLKSIDILSVETRTAFNIATREKIYGVDISKKVKMMINGFDEELLQTFNIIEKKIEEKENLIITVARIGAYEKNNEIILEAAKLISFKDWKIKLIGPVTDDFREKCQLFFEEFPQLREKLIFTGPIYSKRELWEYYNSAKVFLLTSRFEGFAIVYAEALRFCNYIITTDVGGARETLEIGNGEIIEQNNPIHLAHTIQTIINGKNLKCDINSNDISWRNLVDKLNLLK